MGELFDRAFTEQRLLDSWHAVREAVLADGDAGPEVERFEAVAARRVSELAAALAGGSFQPSPVVRVEVAKHGGGVRRLAVPGLADRIVERALLAELDAVSGRGNRARWAHLHDPDLRLPSREYTLRGYASGDRGSPAAYFAVSDPR